MRKPNVLFLFTDDQRFDTIRALGNEHIITPNMDRLACNGVAFSNAYIMGGSCPAVCMPSRAMVMTSRSLFRLRENGRTIPAADAMLPEAFRRAGYETYCTGKWHQDESAFVRGFERGDAVFFGGMCDHFRVPVRDFDPVRGFPEGPPRVEEGVHSSELFSNAAIQFLRTRDADRPFFAYVPYTAPHDPRVMPQQYLDLYDPEAIPLPENFLPEHPFDNGELRIRDELLAPWPRTPDEIRRHLAAYFAMITHVDAELGRILDFLDAAGQTDNTIIVFSGDNGLALGQHGLLGKQNCYEHSVHVPLIFTGPGISKGETREPFCYLNDLFPTLCDLAGLSIPDSVEGVSLVPAMRDPAAKVRDSLVFAYMDVQRALRSEDWKLIRYNVQGTHTTQLFDLSQDPWERNNLAGDPAHAPEVERLGKRLARQLEDAGDHVDLDSPDWGLT